MGDNYKLAAYSQLMREQPAHIVLKLCTNEPMELGNFVSAFTSLASQYDKFIRQFYPDLSSEAEIFVKEISKGSTVADMITFLPDMISRMDQILIIERFIRLYGSRLGTYFLGKPDSDVTKSDLQDFMGQLAAVAKDPNASSTVEAAYFEDGKKKVKAAIKFNTNEARRAVQTIETQRREIEQSAHADYPRVLMVFEQSNVKDTPLGRRTGEWVKIEAISDRSLPLIYASDLAEKRIKHEIREAPDNVYKKGFVVDVNVETRGGKPVAYRVTHVHQVFDLPDDDG